MTRRRWIADEHDGDTAALTGKHAAHLARVLRARVGQEFEIAVADGVRLGRVTHVSDERVQFALGTTVAMPVELCVTLVVAIFKFDRFEWAVEKATELSAARIVPLVAARTDAHLAAAAAKRVERWRRIAREAAEQSRQTAPPEISDPAKFAEALQIEADQRVVLAEAESDISLRQAIESRQVSSLALAIGPEGGWTQRELEQLTAAGWSAATLGSRILRAETAVVAAMAIAQALSTLS